MKKLIILTLALVLLLMPIVTGCVRVDLGEKAGPVTTREYFFTDFTGIDVGHAFEVTITPSDNYTIAITAGENAFEHIDVYKSGNTLVIDVNAWLINWFVSPKLTVTMPVLNELELSGASKGTARGFRSSQALNLHLSGASELDVDIEAGDCLAELSGASSLAGYLTAGSSSFDLSGASEVRLTGTGGDLCVEGSGASHLDLSGFPVNNADIDLSGASHASLNTTGTLDVSLSGASSLEYEGSPTLGRLDISGASDIEQKTEP